MNDLIKQDKKAVLSQDQFSVLNTNRLNVAAGSIYFVLLILYENLTVIIDEISKQSIFIFTAVTAILHGITLIRFFRDQSDKNLKYSVLASYTLCYFLMMFVGHSEFRFAMVFPPLCVMILYHNVAIMEIYSVLAVIINIINVMVCYFILKRTDGHELVRYGIQLGTVLLSASGACIAARIYTASYNANLIKNSSLQKMALQTIETIANTIDAKDSYTQGHSRRVADYSVKIAQYMGFPPEEIERLRYIALLHDVGKIAVPDIVLNKPSRLTNEEFGLLKMHTTAGGDILKDIDAIPDIALGARFHHERYDGKGYPDGLKGEEIPLAARIVCLADAFDAMTSNRIYRKHLSIDVVMEEIRKCRGDQFDPVCVDAFLEYLKQEGDDLDLESVDKATSNNKTIYTVLEEGSEEAAAAHDKDASWDELTGAFSRTSGERYLKELLLEKSGAILLINIVGLKEINKCYGYRRGDHYIKLLAKVLQESRRKPMLTRYCGNEFIAFLPDIVSRDDLSTWVRDMLQRLKEEQDSDYLAEKKFAVSCAITVHNNSSESLDAHIEELSKVLYHIKNSENDYGFYNEGNNEAENDVLSREDIHDVMEMIMDYDPQTGKDVMGDADVMNKLSGLSHITDKDFTLMLFTIKPTDGDNMMPEERSNIMVLLEDAMERAVGSRDNLSSYSSLQRVVLLPGSKAGSTSKEDVDRVEKSILSNFYKMYNKNDVELYCTFKTMST